MIREGNTQSVDLSKKKLKVLVYGPPGSGKTWFGATMPSPYFICADRGLLGVVIAKKDVDFVEFDTFEDLQKVVIDIGMGTRAKERESIILDDLTHLTPLVVDYTLRSVGKSRMDRSTWGIAVDHLRILIKSFNDLEANFHTALLSGACFEKDDNAGMIWQVPDTIGKFAFSIGGLYDEVLFSRQTSKYIEGQMRPIWQLHTIDCLEERAKAKDRSGTLNMVEPNDFDTVFKKFVTGKRVHVNATQYVENFDMLTTTVGAAFTAPSAK